jgi:hypothetical protein
VLLIVIL